MRYWLCILVLIAVGVSAVPTVYTIEVQYWPPWAAEQLRKVDYFFNVAVGLFSAAAGFSVVYAFDVFRILEKSEKPNPTGAVSLICYGLGLLIASIVVFDLVALSQLYQESYKCAGESACKMSKLPFADIFQDRVYSNNVILICMGFVSVVVGFWNAVLAGKS